MKTIIINNKATVEAEGKYNSKHCKPIMCIKTDNSELRSFSSVADAAIQLGINHNYISTCMSKGVKCKGYRFFSTKDAASFIDEIVKSYNSNASDAKKYQLIRAEEEAVKRERERREAAIAKAEAKVTKLAAACAKYQEKFNASMNALDEANKELEALLDANEE